MPCNDITEVVVLRFDRSDHLVSYTLRKQTCGAEIGRAALLADLVLGQDVDALAHLDAADLRGAFAIAPAEEFLYFKHLVALQTAVAVYTGGARGDVGQACTVVEVASDDQGVRFEGLIAVAALTQKIKACGNCGTCGATPRAES